MKQKYWWYLLSVMVILTMVVAACGTTPEPTEAPAPTEEAKPTEAPAPTEEPEPTEAPAEPALSAPAGGFLEKAQAGEYAGTEVSIIGVMVEEEAIKFEMALEPFEEATGIDVVYEPTKEFEAVINVRIDAGDPPDVANFSQPGFVANLARTGDLYDVSQFLSEEWLQQQYNQGWLDMATMEDADGEDVTSGVWHRTSAKSYVWYPKQLFEAAGYEIPTTWDEMLALSDQIVSDGDTPWCIGIESGAATGWVATDWMENIMLRTTSPENYDKWVNHELMFSSPEVKNAAEKMAELWLNEDYVWGGTPAIVSTFIGDSPVPMFEDPPGCWFHAQAPWIQGFFGEGLEAGVDYDFFTLPPIDAEYGTPVLVAGDLMVMFNDRPEVKALIEYFTTGKGVEAWVRAGGAISMHNDSSLDWYTNEIDRRVAESILAASTVRFDASDLMPGEVGAGSFWKAMTDFVSGSVDLDTALQEIDDSWPDDTKPEEPETPAEPALSAPAGGFLEKAQAGEYAGTEVSIIGVMVEEEAIKFEMALEPFEEATGIDVVYEPTKEFEAVINVRIDAGDPPDVANFSQPGFVANLARTGDLYDVSQFLSEEWLQQQYNQGWLDMATMEDADGEDVTSGVWHRTSAKSYVWYPKQLFEAAGYEIPTTWDEMLALSDQIVSDGDTPWCIGIESGAATGWVATDWMENIMLRTTSPENYDKWVNHELMFSSPEVKNAAEKMAELWLNEDYVWGGTPAIVSTFIGDSPVPMFEDPPGCWFHAQAPWIQGFFGEGLEAGVDYDFFTLPPIDAEYGTPVLVAGDLMVMFNDRPEVKALIEYFTTGKGVEAWVRAGGAISMHNDSSLDWYTNEIDRRVAESILAASTVRFDASDLMPGEVGAGSFWKAMTDFVSGSVDLDTALQEIDDSWPE